LRCALRCLSHSRTRSQLLFLYFGIKMLKEGFEAEDGGPSEELAEVELARAHTTCYLKYTRMPTHMPSAFAYVACVFSTRRVHA
jgi:hypothetical protein